MTSVPQSDIDAVYLWCDGSDPEFRRRKEATWKALNLPYNRDDVGELRFADNDELKYSLRSLHENAPWVRRIFLITDRQRPKWLKDSSELTLVDHREIIPADLLPTFNSTVIETYVHRIRGLSEKFLLFNDDTFIKNPVKPDFFFAGDLPIVRLRPEPAMDVSPDEAQKIIDRHRTYSFRETQFRAWLLVCRKHGRLPPMTLAHTVDGMTKTAMRLVLERYPEIIAANRSPFRSGGEVQRMIFALEMLYGMGAKLEIQRTRNFWHKNFWFLYRHPILTSLEGAENDNTRKKIRRLNPVMFCLNADAGMNPNNRRKSRELLQSLFPRPSPFEL